MRASSVCFLQMYQSGALSILDALFYKCKTICKSTNPQKLGIQALDM